MASVETAVSPKNEPEKIGGVEKYEAEDAARTLKRAEEIRMNGKLYDAAMIVLNRELEATRKIVSKGTIKEKAKKIIEDMK